MAPAAEKRNNARRERIIFFFIASVHLLNQPGQKYFPQKSVGGRLPTPSGYSFL
jgi:hypothetical protein